MNGGICANSVNERLKPICAKGGICVDAISSLFSPTCANGTFLDLEQIYSKGFRMRIWWHKCWWLLTAGAPRRRTWPGVHLLLPDHSHTAATSLDLTPSTSLTAGLRRGHSSNGGLFHPTTFSDDVLPWRRTDASHPDINISKWFHLRHSRNGSLYISQRMSISRGLGSRGWACTKRDIAGQWWHLFMIAISGHDTGPYPRHLIAYPVPLNHGRRPGGCPNQRVKVTRGGECNGARQAGRNQEESRRHGVVAAPAQMVPFAQANLG